jgi:hypothetical protein
MASHLQHVQLSQQPSMNWMAAAKMNAITRHRWLTSLIPATQEAEIRRIVV